MNRSHLLALPIVIALALFAGAMPGRADENDYSNTLTMHLPATLSQFNSFDISFVDSRTSTLATTDRNNKSIDVWDTQGNTFLRASAPIFTGLSAGVGCKPTTGTILNNAGGNSGGPNGVVIISRDDENHGHHDSDDGHHDVVPDNGGATILQPAATSLFDLVQPTDSGIPGFPGHDRGDAWAGGAGTGASSVAVVNLNTGAQVGADIPTGGFCRADELAENAGEGEIMIGSPSEPIVFETFISTSGTPGPNSVLARLLFDGNGGGCTSTAPASLPVPGIPGLTHNIQVCHTPAGDVATNGIEQPIVAGGNFYVSVPGPTASPGHVDEINPDTFSVITSTPTFSSPGCNGGPTGLVRISDTEAASACAGGVTFVKLGATPAEDGAPVAGSGGADEIWYSGGNVYAPNSAAGPAGCAYLTSVTVLTVPPTASQTNSCLAVVQGTSGSSAKVVSEVQLPADAGSHSVAADDQTREIFVPVKDLDCTPGAVCPPAFPSVTPCASTNGLGQADCIHDQGVAVIVQSR